MKYLNEYHDIMARYRAGEFGSKSLSMYDILDKANNPRLMGNMDLTEIQHLIDSASGITKNMFSLIKQKTESRIITMERLERELKQYDIDSYRGSTDTSDEALARNLRLVVKYCSSGELPSDTEAMLCPIDDEVYLGIIKIQKDCATPFSFRHELIHYFKDVKVGNRVTSEFTRKIKGKTPNDEEQDVNYLTAASIMPIEEIRTMLDEFERTTTQEAEKKFLSGLAKRYEQDEDVMLRRLIEVRCLVDYANIVSA